MAAIESTSIFPPPWLLDSTDSNPSRLETGFNFAFKLIFRGSRFGAWTESGNMTPSITTLQRTKSDVSSDFFTKEVVLEDDDPCTMKLPTLSEIELAKCECCGMSEECTSEYIEDMREKFSGKLVCGLCGEAVKEEMQKNGGKREKALEEHMSACVRFNRIGRAYPALYQADDVRKILKKSCSVNNNKSLKKGGIARSSSCIPAITQDMQDKLRV